MSLPSITIADAATGSRAIVLPTFGFNCLSFCPGGRAEDDVLWSLSDFTSGQQRPSRSGTPLLFPYPGRLHGHELKYQGRTYVLEGDDGLGNAIHGYVLGRPWQVTEQTASRVVGRFAVEPGDAEWAARWPAAFSLSVAYEVRGRALHCTLSIHNPDTKPLPFGLGLHPWFRLPAGAAADNVRVQAPAAKRYEQANMLPTGKLLDAAGNFDLRTSPRFADLKLDDVYTGLTASGGQVETSLTMPAAASGGADRRVTISFSDNFSHCVVFTPAHREAICIEPYTCAPNAYELTAAGVPAGLEMLAPGATVEYWMQIAG